MYLAYVRFIGLHHNQEAQAKEALPRKDEAKPPIVIAFNSLLYRLVPPIQTFLDLLCSLFWG